MSLKTRNIFRDDRGQLLTLDILVSLIPLVLILGISANAMTGSVNQVQEYIFVYDMQRGINSAIDIIVKSPGTPVNWNISNSPEIAGLATYNLSTGLVVPNFLDVGKVVGMNNSHLSILLGGEIRGISYWNLNITGADNKSQGFFLNITNGSRAEAKDLFVAERIALLKIEDIIGGLFDITHKNSETNCNTGGGQGKPSQYQFVFTVTASKLASMDFWMVAEVNDTNGPNSNWGIDVAPFIGDITSNCDDYYKIGQAGNADYSADLFKCTVGNPPYLPGSGQDEICDIDGAIPGGMVYKVKLDSYMAAGENRIFIYVGGDPKIDFDVYFIETPSGTTDTTVTPDLADPSIVKVRLEAGR